MLSQQARRSLAVALANPGAYRDISRVLELMDSTGPVYYVSSDTGSDSAGAGLHPDSPYATLDYAVDQMTTAKNADNGTTIFVMPGHTETVAAAADIAVDVSGISIIGLGHGNARPTFTWSATASTWTVTAANCYIQNIRCTSSIDEMVKMFSVTAAHCTLDAVDVFQTSAANIIQFLLTDASAGDITVKNCSHYQVQEAGGSQAWIQLIGCDRARVVDNRFHLKLADVATSAVISNITTACLGVDIARNNITMTGYSASLVSAILLLSTTTGNVADNRIGTNTAANTTINVAAGCYSFNNLCTNVADTSGIVDPVVDI